MKDNKMIINYLNKNNIPFELVTHHLIQKKTEAYGFLNYISKDLILIKNENNNILIGQIALNNMYAYQDFNSKKSFTSKKQKDIIAKLSDIIE